MKRFISFGSKSSLQELWEAQLDIALKFKEICDKHELNYFLSDSSLIGAVRMGTFLPWKEGITFGMKREEYNKFLEYADKELSDNYEIQHPDRVVDAYHGGYTYIRNNNTTCIDVKDIHSDYSQGVWIKIAPVDYSFENKYLRRLQSYMVRFNQNIMYANMYDNMNTVPSVPKSAKKLFKSYSRFINVAFTIQKLDRWTSSCNNSNTAVFFLYKKTLNDYIYFDKSILDKYVDIEFNGIKFKTVERYEELLICLKGENYLKLPDKSKRVPVSKDYYVDVKTPYKESLKKIIRDRALSIADIPNYNVLRNKTVVVFGEEKLINHFIRNEHYMYHPRFVVTDNEKEIGKQYTYNEYNVYDIKELLNIPDDKKVIIICSNDYIKKARILLKMGIESCYIYCHESSGLEKPLPNCKLTYCLNGYPVIYDKIRYF